MEQILNSGEMKQVDSYSINQHGISARLLMETAALCCYEVLSEWLEEQSEQLPAPVIGILAGTGNNGGDALALLRILLQYPRFSVRLLLVGDTSRSSLQWQEQYRLLNQEKQSFPEMHLSSEKEYDDSEIVAFLQPCTVLVDGIFGIGLGREVTGVYGQVLRCASRCFARKLAIDMPSGLSADTGQVLGTALKADITVTFGYKKCGQVLDPGRSDWCGQLRVMPIGFAPDAIAHLQLMGLLPWKRYMLEMADVKELLPVRPSHSHKGSFGRLAVLGGAWGMAGAVLTAGLAAYRSGVGLVTVISDEENRNIIQSTLWEAVYVSWNRQWQSALSGMAALVMGPGLGTSPKAFELMRTVFMLLSDTPNKPPVVLDADALNLIAAHPELGELVRAYAGKVIMTPHILELARLLGEERTAEVTADLQKAACECAEKYQAICVAKDSVTVTAVPENQSSDGMAYIYINTTGNHGMATGGSGDALAGLIGGLLAQGMSAETAAPVGVWLHGAAGDAASAQIGTHGCMARDIVQGIASVLKLLE